MRIESNEPPDVCIQRLQEALAPLTVLARLDLVASRRYVGRAWRPDDIRVRPVGPSAADGVRVWHLSTPGFRGRLLPSGTGSVLEGRIRINPVVPAFGLLMVVVLAGWLSAGISELVIRLQRGDGLPPGYGFGGLIMPVAFGLMLAIIYVAGYVLYARERRDLVTFLESVVGATPR